MIYLQRRKSANITPQHILLAWICSPLLFAHTGQEPLNSFRERKGFALRAPASSWASQTEVLTEEERRGRKDNQHDANSQRSLAVMLARTRKKGWAITERSKSTPGAPVSCSMRR